MTDWQTWKQTMGVDGQEERQKRERESVYRHQCWNGLPLPTLSSIHSFLLSFFPILPPSCHLRPFLAFLPFLLTHQFLVRTSSIQYCFDLPNNMKIHVSSSSPQKKKERIIFASFILSNRIFYDWNIYSTFIPQRTLICTFIHSIINCASVSKEGSNNEASLAEILVMLF